MGNAARSLIEEIGNNYSLTARLTALTEERGFVKELMAYASSLTMITISSCLGKREDCTV
jgi:hypothetical protein